MQQIRKLLKEIENNASMIEVLVENLISDARQKDMIQVMIYDKGMMYGMHVIIATLKLCRSVWMKT